MDKYHKVVQKFLLTRGIYSPKYRGNQNDPENGGWSNAYLRIKEEIDNYLKKIDKNLHRIFLEQLISNEEHCKLYSEAEVNSLNLKNVKSVKDLERIKEETSWIDLINLEIKYCKYLLNYVDNPRNENEETSLSMPSNLFKDVKSFSLFMDWHNEFKDSRTRTAYYSFIIRRMLKDELMLEVKLPKYLEYLRTIDIDIEKIKTLDASRTPSKESIYLKLKEKHSIG